ADLPDHDARGGAAAQRPGPGDLRELDHTHAGNGDDRGHRGEPLRPRARRGLRGRSRGGGDEPPGRGAREKGAERMMFAISAVAILGTMGMAIARGLLGPTVYDRALAVNMFGTATVLLIVVLGFLTGRPDFLDLALVYALLSF